MSNVSRRASKIKTEKYSLDKEVSKRFTGVMIIGTYLNIVSSLSIDSKYIQQVQIKRRRMIQGNY